MATFPVVSADSDHRLLSCNPSGYAAFTVSPTATDSVRRYIATQEAHHHKHSFVAELTELLNAAGIEFDEKSLL